jgi:hypothetical protein
MKEAKEGERDFIDWTYVVLISDFEWNWQWIGGFFVIDASNCISFGLYLNGWIW